MTKYNIIFGIINNNIFYYFCILLWDQLKNYYQIQYYFWNDQ